MQVTTPQLKDPVAKRLANLQIIQGSSYNLLYEPLK